MDWNSLFSPSTIWMVVGLCLLILEFVVPGLVILFFGLGALLVGAMCMSMDMSLNAQLATFLGVSVVMLATLRHWSSEALGLRGSSEPGAGDRDVYLGARAKVVREITPRNSGRVDCHGTSWDAASSQPIPAGDTVVVVGRENLTLIVEPAD